MKRSGITWILFICLIVIIAISMCACGHKDKPAASDTVNVEITNKVPDRISVMAVSYSINGETVGTNCVEIAEGGKCLGEGILSFPITRDQIENEKDLQDLSITVSVTEVGGGSFDAVTLDIPSQFGDTHHLELQYQDGSYSVWQQQE